MSDTFNFDSPLSIDSLSEVDLWATEYYVHITKSEGTIPYLTGNGDTLGYFSDTCDFCTACLEGTVFIESDSSETVVLNYASRSNPAIVNCRLCDKFKNSTLNVESLGSVRWKVSSDFGDGVLNYRLVPYRTIAVDPNKIPYGTVLFLPESRGTVIHLADGTTCLHDGYFFAGDTGGAIKTNHIDVFTGVDSSHPFAFVKSSSAHTTACYIVSSETIITSLTVLHEK